MTVYATFEAAQKRVEVLKASGTWLGHRPHRAWSALVCVRCGRLFTRGEQS